MTRGSPLGLTTLLSQVNLSNGVVTACAHDNNSRPVMGQIRCAVGKRNARLTFLYPDTAYDSPALSLLLDGLAHLAGTAGSYGLLAEVDEQAPVFEALRRAGYTVYGWQRVYRLPFDGKPGTDSHLEWCFATSEDEIPIRQLFHALVPPLVQAAEPLPSNRLYGLVYRERGQILAYVESEYGPDGIYLKPLIHPDVSSIDRVLASLQVNLLPLLGRKVYLSVRSHHSWLEIPLSALGAQASDRQALMVKHLATMQRKPVFSMARSVAEEGAVKPTSPPAMGNSKNPLENDLSGARHSSLPHDF